MFTNTAYPDNTGPFDFPCKANQKTEWVRNPANSTHVETGDVQKGEIIWFHVEPFGSGPTWQPARLADNTLGFVHPYHFDKALDA
ncbi:hypothetical protein [Larkinella soli]|uniref:hypothetical protein n=1 Tax=Larkinella soli TaxID=1770527 RepID=UPI000FFBCF05|nr:hypothetical protein [Larkinella soli]